MNVFNKKLVTLVMSAPLLITFNAVGDSGYDKAIEDDLISACKSAALNDKHGVRKSAYKIFPNTKHMSNSLRTLSQGLVCNGMQVTEFARVYGADDTYAMFKRYSPQRTKVEIKDIEVSYQRENLSNITAVLK
jgi:hypothetical protein